DWADWMLASKDAQAFDNQIAIAFHAWMEQSPFLSVCSEFCFENSLKTLLFVEFPYNGKKSINRR
ncbi:MAG: hypothetical protein Q4D90_08220, partial [bacterium]|nr:hypothetical protein [bacterium]